MRCNIFPKNYGFIDKLFFAAILNICKNIENPANPSRNAVIINWIDICFVCIEETRFTPFVSSSNPVKIHFPYSGEMCM